MKPSLRVSSRPCGQRPAGLGLGLGAPRLPPPPGGAPPRRPRGPAPPPPRAAAAPRPPRARGAREPRPRRPSGPVLLALGLLLALLERAGLRLQPGALGGLGLGLRLVLQLASLAGEGVGAGPGGGCLLAGASLVRAGDDPPGGPAAGRGSSGVAGGGASGASGRARARSASAAETATTTRRPPPMSSTWWRSRPRNELGGRGGNLGQQQERRHEAPLLRQLTLSSTPRVCAVRVASHACAVALALVSLLGVLPACIVEAPTSEKSGAAAAAGPRAPGDGGSGQERRGARRAGGAGGRHLRPAVGHLRGTQTRVVLVFRAIKPSTEDWQVFVHWRTPRGAGSG